MSLPIPEGSDGPLTVRQEAELVKAQLQDYVAKRGGSIAVMQSVAHLWEEVRKAAADGKALRVLIAWNGEEPWGDSDKDTSHRVERRWLVAAVMPKPFEDELGDYGVKYRAVEGGEWVKEHVYDTVENLRDGVRVMTNVSEDVFPRYKGTSPMPNPFGGALGGNVFLNAYAIEFSTLNDVQQVGTQEPEE